jgi:hypothetical protein
MNPTLKVLGAKVKEEKLITIDRLQLLQQQLDVQEGCATLANLPPL